MTATNDTLDAPKTPTQTVDAAKANAYAAARRASLESDLFTGNRSALEQAQYAAMVTEMENYRVLGAILNVDRKF